jgi:CHAT domain-containing protein
MNENEAYSYFLKGYTCINNGKIDSALFFFTSVTDYYQKANNKIYLAPAYVNLGIVSNLFGDYTLALSFYQKAEELYFELKDSAQLFYVYFSKANIFETQKDYKKAEQYYLQALAILNKNPFDNKQRIASIYNNLGILYRNTGNNEKAIDYFLVSIKLKENSDKLFSAYGNLALSYERLNKTDEADRYYLKTLENIEQNYGKASIFYALNQINYGTFLLNKKNDLKKSLENLQQALSVYQSVYGQKSTELSFCYNRIGEYYIKAGDYKKALLNFQKSLVALSDSFTDTTEFSNPEIQSVLSKTHFLRALKNKTIALNYLSESAVTSISYLEKSLQTNKLAIDVLKDIRIGFLSEQSKLFLAENEQEIYGMAIETCYSLYKLTLKTEYIQEAFRFAELGKATILAEAMQNNTALIHGNIPPHLADEINSIEKKCWMIEEMLYEEQRKSDPSQEKIDNWNKQLFELSEKKSSLTNEIEENYPEYFKLKYDQSIIDIKQIQTKLGRNDVLIDYSLHNQSLFTFVVSKYDYQLFHQSIDSVFFNATDNLIKSITDNNLSKHTSSDYELFKSSSFTLYNTLIKPFTALLNRKQLIIVPDGKLAYIPFEILIKENKTTDLLKYKNLPYLLFDYPVSYSYSAKLFSESSHSSKKATQGLIAFAPEYKNQEIDHNIVLQTRQQYREKLFPLKGIKEEAKNVSEMLNGDTFLDDDASEQNFKKLAGDYDILHLAMHTLLNDKDPMFSKMAFSASNDTIEDGFLNTYEVYNMQLTSRMAVLSSCNTGSGLLNRGEGVMSLARGFIFAGCPSIVMTLWTVEDKSGVQLMTHFYEKLKYGKNKARALQQAKIDFLQQADPLKSHPYYWSGYVVIGNKNPLFYTLYFYFGIGILVIVLMVVAIIIIKNKKKNGKLITQ